MASNNRITVLEKVVEYADLDVGELTEWEETFVASMKERFERFGVDVTVSDKQYATLERILKKQEEAV